MRRSDTGNHFGRESDRNAQSTGRELVLKYRTRANTPLTDKKNIFLHYVKEDESSAQEVIRQILDFENGIEYAIWSAEDPDEVFIGADSDEIGQMAVFIPVVTEHYLNMAQSAGLRPDGRALFDLMEINDHNTAVLPVFLEPESCGRFNRLFGDMHGLFLNAERDYEKLEESLKSFLGDNALSGKIIKDAFSMNLFLSYRKKDRKSALEIMKKIHDTEEGGRAAIWFDDFLVPGDDFNHQILEIMEQADAMVLSVTPNILEKDNYVKTIEYPEAKERMGKKIIPVETEKTDIDRLNADFAGIGDIVDVNDSGKINETMKTVESKEKEREFTAYQRYLLGMAFLSGLRVEKDVERAVELFESAAKDGIYQACLQLGFLYLSGKGVKRDHEQAVKWNRAGYDSLKQNFSMARLAAKASTGNAKEKNEEEIIKNINGIYDVCFGKDGLFLLLSSLGRVPEAVLLGQEFADLIELLENDGRREDRWCLWKAEAYIEIADLHFDTRITQERFEQAQRYLRWADDALNSYIGDEKLAANVLFAKYEYAHGEIRVLERSPAATACFERADAIMQKVTEQDGREEYRKIHSGILGRLGLLQRDEGFSMSLRHPLNSISLMEKAKRTLGRALVLEQDLAAERPTIHNREGLAIALFNYALVEDKKAERANFMLRAADIVEELQKETGDGSFDDFERQLKKVMKKMRIKRK